MRLIFAIVSTTSILQDVPECSRGGLWTHAPQEGSLLDADHAGSEVLIARRSKKRGCWPAAAAVLGRRQVRREGVAVDRPAWLRDIVRQVVVGDGDPH